MQFISPKEIKIYNVNQVFLWKWSLKSRQSVTEPSLETPHTMAEHSVWSPTSEWPQMGLQLQWYVAPTQESTWLWRLLMTAMRSHLTGPALWSSLSGTSRSCRLPAVHGGNLKMDASRDKLLTFSLFTLCLRLEWLLNESWKNLGGFLKAFSKLLNDSLIILQ